jgi:hypothetical protein
VAVHLPTGHAKLESQALLAIQGQQVQALPVVAVHQPTGHAKLGLLVIQAHKVHQVLAQIMAPLGLPMQEGQAALAQQLLLQMHPRLKFTPIK